MARLLCCNLYHHGPKKLTSSIEVIGEAARNIPKEIQAKYSHIPWAEIIATRNVIAHDYFEIDYKIVWNIIRNHLPTLKKELELILQEIDNTPKL
jgi:uncharacterized protein with HEPN domain